MTQIRIIGNAEELAALEPQWWALWRLAAAPPFLAPAWLLPVGIAVSDYLVSISSPIQAMRRLRPGGEMAIFNFSCRDDLLADRVELERLAREHALALVGVDERPCASWDAPASHLVKLGPSDC